jgi:hypothetical protein
MRRPNDKHIKEIRDDLLRKGWTAENKGRHTKMKTPCGRLFISLPQTPSDHRAHENLRHQIHRIEMRLIAMGPKR